MSSPSRRRHRHNRHSSSSPNEYSASVSKRVKQSTDQHDKNHRRSSGERDSDRRYTSICVKNISPKISDNEVRRLCEKKFSNYGPNTIKIYYKNHERVAFVNFTNCDDAKHARHAKSGLIWDNWQLIIEPVYYRRHYAPDHPLYDVRNKYSPSRPAPERSQAAFAMRDSPFFSKPRSSPHNHRSHPYARAAPPRRYSPNVPLPSGLDGFARKDSRRHRRGSSNSSPRSTHSNNNNNNNNDNDDMQINSEDQEATRTIFVGNLERDITEEQLRDIFDNYGVIEEIDLKIPGSSSKRPYAFIQYQNLDMACKAKSQQDGRLIGKSEARIGFGKVVPTTCLWVGNLHPQLKRRDLEHEFARYGQIKSIEFSTGDKQAYIVYKDVEDAIKAREKLRGTRKLAPTTKKRVSRSGSSTSSTRSPSRYQLRIDYHESNSSHHSVVSNKKSSHQHRNHSATDKVSKRKASSSSSAASHTSLSKGIQGQIERVRSVTPRQRSPSPRSPVSLADEEQESIKQQTIDEPTSPHKRHRSSSPSPTKRQRNKRERSSSPGRTTYGPFSVYISPHATSNLTKMNDFIILCEQLNEESVQSTKSLSTVYPVQFLLKSHHYDARMHFLAGNPQICVNVLGQPGDLVAAKTELKVTQRLRLDPTKLDDLESKLRSNSFGSSKNNKNVNGTTSTRKTSPSTANFAILVSSPRKKTPNDDVGDETKASSSSPAHEGDENKQLSPDFCEGKSLSLLITYLATKEAAGVISIQYHPSTSTFQQQLKEQTAVLHAFPPCDFSKKLLREVCPLMSFGGGSAGPATPRSEVDEYVNDEHLLVVIVKND
ncbi:unnamed protein product [Didymodactylos carnosus]|uniref:Uncharacterized protein n=1 Tax=Didymodactylos carnosus TaxID=1234261 RepID=A0A813R938_9BILA|nr:unnamed protein product [Didymodactylos carnosus]CAF0898513.1 unnamed protein product [Didymodactylos carnosus]CAF3560364.1 unnamed protein product [Didymodactylos carnosus]CAF3679674.1 unnamed protein product [Didymodactylos carnosus]